MARIARSNENSSSLWDVSSVSSKEACLKGIFCNVMYQGCRNCAKSSDFAYVEKIRNDHKQNDGGGGHTIMYGGKDVSEGGETLLQDLYILVIRRESLRVSYRTYGRNRSILTWWTSHFSREKQQSLTKKNRCGCADCFQYNRCF